MTLFDSPPPHLRHGRDIFRAFQSDPISTLQSLAGEAPHGVEFRVGSHAFLLLTDPALIDELLVQRAADTEKGPGLLRARPVLGTGLLTHPTSGHIAYKRRLQPAFRRSSVDAHSPAMAAAADTLAANLADREPLDVHALMMRLTLDIVTQTLFASDTVPDHAAVARAVSQGVHSLYAGLATGAEPPRCPVTEHVAALEAALGAVLAGRRPVDDPSTDFVSLLLSPDDEPLPPEQIRDEALTIFLAGHESVANCLSWTWYLLSQNPDLEALFHQELDAGGVDCPVTNAILLESMRLYPPAWMISRSVRQEIMLGGEVIAAGTVVIAAQCVTHRDPRFYPQPDKADITRWDPDTAAARPRYAYFPFGAGPRVCIGEQFALRELTTVLTRVGRRWRFAAVPDTNGEWEPLVTLRPRHGIVLRPERR